MKPSRKRRVRFDFIVGTVAFAAIVGMLALGILAPEIWPSLGIDLGQLPA
jgi:hypothetical protein